MVALAVGTWLAGAESSACKCATQPEASGFATLTSLLPPNAKGVLWRTTPPVGVWQLGEKGSSWVVIDGVPQPPAASAFTLTDLTGGQQVKLRVRHLQERIFESDLRYLAPPRPGKAECMGEELSGSCVATAMRAGRLKDSTVQVLATTGLFRIEPVVGFVPGHRYRLTTSLQEGPRKLPARPLLGMRPRSGEAFEFEIGARPLLLAEDRMTLEREGPAGVRALPVAAGSMCSSITVAAVQDLTFRASDELAPFEAALRYFVVDSADARRRRTYTPSVCTPLVWGQSALGIGRERVWVDCAAGSEPGSEQTLSLRGRWAFLEVDERFFLTEPLTVSLDARKQHCAPRAVVTAARARRDGPTAMVEALCAVAHAPADQGERLETLLEAARTSDWIVREAALAAMAALAARAADTSGSRTAATVLGALLDDMLDPSAARPLNELIRAAPAGCPSRADALEIARILGVGSDADVRPLLPTLRRGLAHSDERIRLRFLGVLGQLGQRGAPLAKDLVTLLTGRQGAEESKAILLAWRGSGTSQDPRIKAAVQRLATSEDATVRAAANDLLSR